MPLSFERIKQHGTVLEREFSARVSGYIIGALGLVAGLAWNDAIKALIEFIFPLRQDSISAKFLYAGIITIIIVLVTLYIVQLFNKPDSPE